jgi:hypothetical protein
MKRNSLILSIKPVRDIGPNATTIAINTWSSRGPLTRRSDHFCQFFLRISLIQNGVIATGRLITREDQEQMCERLACRPSAHELEQR